jgi:hypothetical protein
VGKYLNYLDAKNAARLVSPFHWDKHATVAPPTLAVAGGRGDAAAKQGGQAWHPTFSSWTLGVMSLPSPPHRFAMSPSLRLLIRSAQSLGGGRFVRLMVEAARGVEGSGGGGSRGLGEAKFGPR